LVLWNRGFTNAAFFDYRVRFQHALHSIAGKREDSDLLLFLTAYVRSRLARYFVFHTSASLGTERDQVHMVEALRLPFFLPDDDVARALAAKVTESIHRLKDEMEAGAAKLKKKPKSTEFHLRSEGEGTDKEEWQEWLEHQREKSRELQAELEPLIYQYFGLNEQEIALVEDTCEIFDKSDTPGSLDAAKSIPTLQPLEAAGLEPYTGMLTTTLNGWASGTLRISGSGGVDGDLGLAIVELNQTKTANSFKTRAISAELADALKRLQEVSTQRSESLAYLRGAWVFDGTRIYIVKPAFKGQWTRTAALNDAADLYTHVAEARRRAR